MFAVLSYEIGREVESLRVEGNFSDRREAGRTVVQANDIHEKAGSPIRFYMEYYHAHPEFSAN